MGFEYSILTFLKYEPPKSASDFFLDFLGSHLGSEWVNCIRPKGGPNVGLFQLLLSNNINTSERKNLMSFVFLFYFARAHCVADGGAGRGDRHRAAAGPRG